MSIANILKLNLSYLNVNIEYKHYKAIKNKWVIRSSRGSPGGISREPDLTVFPPGYNRSLPLENRIIKNKDFS